MDTKEELKKGQIVNIGMPKPKSDLVAWVVHVQKTGEECEGTGARTRSKSRPDKTVFVVFDVTSTEVHEFSSRKNKITAIPGPNFYEQQRVSSTVSCKKRLSHLSGSERERCDDLTNGGHPPDEILITKYHTTLCYGHFYDRIGPCKWLSCDFINFYMQVFPFTSFILHHFLTYSSILPHLFLITSSLIPHYFLTYSSLLPHLFLITSSLIHR